jgi:hypothetical protein
MNSPTIRIILRGECSKLTPRGKGTLSYEFGINDGDIFIRIAANSQGRTCSFEWIKLQTIEDLLENRGVDYRLFSAVLLRKAFISRSANNHGYLAAILKSEKIIGVSPEQPAKLTYLSFDSMKDRLNQLKTEDLPDLVAAEKQRKTPIAAKPLKKGRPKKKC